MPTPARLRWGATALGVLAVMVTMALVALPDTADGRKLHYQWGPLDTPRAMAACAVVAWAAVAVAVFGWLSRWGLFRLRGTAGTVIGVTITIVTSIAVVLGGAVVGIVALLARDTHVSIVGASDGANVLIVRNDFAFEPQPPDLFMTDGRFRWVEVDPAERETMLDVLSGCALSASVDGRRRLSCGATSVTVPMS